MHELLRHQRVRGMILVWFLDTLRFLRVQTDLAGEIALFHLMHHVLLATPPNRRLGQNESLLPVFGAAGLRACVACAFWLLQPSLVRHASFDLGLFCQTVGCFLLLCSWLLESPSLGRTLAWTVEAF